MKKYQIKFPHGVMFHHFHDNTGLYQGSISKKNFYEILDYIKLENILSADEWSEEIKKKGNKMKKVCLTFDDCLISQYKYALPILNELKIKAFWFPYTSIFKEKKANMEIYRFFRVKYFSNINKFYEQFFDLSKKKYGISHNNIRKEKINNLKKIYPFYSINDIIFRILRDNHLSEEQFNSIMGFMINQKKLNKKNLINKLFIDKKKLIKISKNHIIGLHSHTHPTNLSRMSYLEQKKEYFNNFKYLKEIINKPILSMSHPCNSYDKKTIKILKKLKIQIGFRANMEKKFQKLLETPRIDHSNIMKQIN